MWLQRRALQRDPEAAADWPVLDFRRASVRRTALVVVALTAVNVVIVLLAGYGSLHWMESPSFCGQVCHTPMQPQFTRLAERGRTRESPASAATSARAPAAFVHAKLAGVRQLVHVVTDSFRSRSRPAPRCRRARRRRPASAVTSPERVAGDRIRVIREYADDEANSETMTVLQMHVGGRGHRRARFTGTPIPPSASSTSRPTPTRQTIPYVKVTDASGQVKEYRRADDTTGRSRSRRHAADDGLHRLPQHGRPPDLADRRRGPSTRPSPPGWSAASCRSCGAKVSACMKAAYPARTPHCGHRSRPAELLRSQGRLGVDQQALARTHHGAPGRVSPQRVPHDEGDVGHLSRPRATSTSTGCFRCHDDSHKAKDGIDDQRRLRVVSQTG